MSIVNAKQITSQTLLNVISTLNDDDLIKIFNSFISFSDFSVEKSCKVTSYKCYESVYICNGKIARGFGRNEKEANVHCIRNLIQLLQGDDRVIKIFRECFSKMNDEQQFENSEAHTQEIIPVINPMSQLQQNANNILQKESNKTVINSNPYQNNPNSFHISHMDFRNSYENFYSEAKQNQQHLTSVGNNSNTNSATTPLNMGTQSQQNQSSFSKYYNDTLNANSATQPGNQFLSMNKSMSQPHPDDYQTQSQQQHQNLFTSQGEEYHRTNTMSSTSGNTAQQQLNTSINLQTTSQTNFYTHLQHSAPKEKPVIQAFANTSNDGITNVSTSNKQSLQPKSSFEDSSFKIGQAPLPQHKHQRNKSVIIPSNYQTVQNNNIVPTQNVDYSQSQAAKSVEKDQKYIAMEDELKKSKNYIEHLERKIKLVVEENKILKSLLLENKKSNNQNGNKGMNNTSDLNTSNLSMNNLNKTYNQSSNMKQGLQIGPANENLPPSSSTFQNSQINSTKQPYFFPVGSASGNIQTTQNNNALNHSNINNNYQTQQNALNTSFKDTSVINENINKNQNSIDPQLKQQNQNILASSNNNNNILKDFNNKANIIANAQIISGDTQKIKAIGNPSPQPIDENLFKITNEKFRSLSVDINAKRCTLGTENSSKKLDTSLIETSQCNKMMGHTKYKNKIPKLNLQILPNYHGNSNKSINQQLLQQYQATQTKNANKGDKQK